MARLFSSCSVVVHSGTVPSKFVLSCPRVKGPLGYLVRSPPAAFAVLYQCLYNMRGSHVLNLGQRTIPFAGRYGLHRTVREVLSMCVRSALFDQLLSIVHGAQVDALSMEAISKRLFGARGGVKTLRLFRTGSKDSSPASMYSVSLTL